MYMKSRPDLRSLLDIPVMQAPTGSIAGPELAAAVSQGGGIGAMGITWSSPEAATEAIQYVKQRTDRAFQVNFALAFPPESLAAALEAGAPIVTFSWGNPEPYVKCVQQSGALCGVQVTSAAGAMFALSLGADFLICQGIEAGGHVQSSTSLRLLLPQVLAVAGHVPVVASGGIGDGEAARIYLDLGAAAVMMGTRFVAAMESRAHDLYKQMLTQARSEDTALTVCFDGGWPGAMHRVLRNSTLEAWEAAGSPPSGHRPGENEPIAINAAGETIERYSDTAPRTGFEGQIDAMCLYSGTSVDKIHSVLPAAEILAQLRCELVRTGELPANS
jgi:nitronate monooxygenase